MTTADLKSALPQLGSRATPRRVRNTRPNYFSRSDRLEVIHLSAECWPFARTGGLGEAVAGLAAFQAGRGIGVTVVMPLYRAIREAAIEMQAVGAPFSVPVGACLEEVQLYRTPMQSGKPRMFFIDHKPSFDRDGIYGEGGADYPDNARRFALFSLAALSRTATHRSWRERRARPRLAYGARHCRLTSNPEVGRAWSSSADGVLGAQRRLSRKLSPGNDR